MKFTRYAKSCKWTDDEALSCLGWCIVGKTLDYYAVISRGKETFSYKTLLRKLGERFGEHELLKTVDTAAQVTIISDWVFDSLQRKPEKIRDVKLLTAGRDLAISGKVVEPVRLKIGERWYMENVYVVPIDQEMLLGFDILRDKG